MTISETHVAIQMRQDPECDDSEAAHNRVVKKVARKKPKPVNKERLQR